MQTSYKRRSGVVAISAVAALVLAGCTGDVATESTGPAPVAQEGVGPGYLVDY